MTGSYPITRPRVRGRQIMTSDVAFLTPDQYAKLYQRVHGKAAPASLVNPSVELTVAGEGVLSPAQPGSTAVRDNSTSVVPMDPPGGGGDPAWDVILYSFWDGKKNYIPLRLGNSELGYNHYAATHNLTTFAPFKALSTEKPKATGARLEYVAYATKLDNAQVKATVYVLAQAASRTDDGKYKTRDARRRCACRSLIALILAASRQGQVTLLVNGVVQA